MKRSTVRFLVLTQYMQFGAGTKTISTSDKLELMPGTDRILRKLNFSYSNYYLYDRNKTYVQNIIDVEDSFKNYKPNSGSKVFHGFLIPNKIKTTALKFNPDLSTIITGTDLTGSEDAPSLRLNLNKNSFKYILEEQILHPANQAEQHNLKASYVLKSPTNCFFLTSNSIRIAD